MTAEEGSSATSTMTTQKINASGTQSPELAGGAGFTFEGSVGGLYLAALLGEAYAPGMEDRTVTRVAARQGQRLRVDRGEDLGRGALTVCGQNGLLCPWKKSARTSGYLLGKYFLQRGKCDCESLCTDRSQSFCQAHFIYRSYLIEQDHTAFASVADRDAKRRWFAACGHGRDDHRSQVMVHFGRRYHNTRA